MAVLLGVFLAGVLVFARRPLWAAGTPGKSLYMAIAVSAVALILLLVVERIEAMGEYQ
jgi:high-affinity nickel permease